MMLYIIGAVFATLVVAGFLLSQPDTLSGSYRSRNRLAEVFVLTFAVLAVALIWCGGIAYFIGGVCVVLKLLGVEPVASWTWLEAFLPFIAGVVAQVTGYLITEAFD